MVLALIKLYRPLACTFEPSRLQELRQFHEQCPCLLWAFRLLCRGRTSRSRPEKWDFTVNAEAPLQKKLQHFGSKFLNVCYSKLSG